MNDKIALVTGASQGLGLETARQLLLKGFQVVITGRDADRLQEAAKSLPREVTTCLLDVTDEKAAAAVAHAVTEQFGRLDVLVNNAGAFFEPTSQAAMTTTKIATTSIAAFESSFRNNTLGAVIVTSALLPLLRLSATARVVNVSTSMASLANMTQGWPAYRVSKTALNAVTRIFADEMKDSTFKINSVSPGWVRTAMGGPSALRSIEEGAEIIVWAATLPENGPTGGFFESGEQVPW